MNRALTAVLALLTLSIAQIAEAQRPSSARIGVNVNAGSRVSASLPNDTTTVRDSTGGRHILRGAFIGAGIGAIGGLVTAFFITQRPRTGNVDHSEDGLVIIPLLEASLIAGFVIGGVVGFFWR